MKAHGDIGLAIAAIALVAAFVPAAAVAQSNGSARGWEARAEYEYTSVAERRDWNSVTVGVERAFSGLTLQLQGRRVSRFGRTDRAADVDAYVDLWDGGYTHMFGRVTPGAEVLPSVDAGAEYFQAVGNGWEPSVSVRRMDFGRVDVDLFGVAVAKYLPGWYLRPRVQYVRRQDGEGVVGSLQARRYLGTPDSYVELSVGGGRDVVTVAGGPRTEVRGSQFGTLLLRKMVGKGVGVLVTAQYVDEGARLERGGVSAGVLVRW